MVWRGRSSPQDRVWACLAYLLPLLEIVPLGGLLYGLVPPIYVLFSPFIAIYTFKAGLASAFSIMGFSILDIAIFFGLFVGVVRNPKISHLVRFNVLQAIMLGIGTSLVITVLQLLGILQQAFIQPIGLGQAGGFSALFSLLIVTALFVLVAAASIFAIVQSARGRYAEIPAISESAYNLLRY
ncbi:MAG: Tic20 family protein [Cyanobacteria bacterium P01_H01_bin.15]